MVAASHHVHRRTEKEELCRLATKTQHTTRCTLAELRRANATKNEVINIVAEVAATTVKVLEEILGTAAMSPDVPAMVQKVSSNKWLARLSVRSPTKTAPEMAVATLERLEKLEECISGLASGSEKFFR